MNKSWRGWKKKMRNIILPRRNGQSSCSRLLLIVLFLAMIGVGVSMIADGNRAVKTGSSRVDDEVVDSKTLHSEMNRNLKRDGKSSIESINTVGGVSTNNLARKDKSWTSVPDFFVKAFRKK